MGNALTILFEFCRSMLSNRRVGYWLQNISNWLRNALVIDDTDDSEDIVTVTQKDNSTVRVYRKLETDKGDVKIAARGVEQVLSTGEVRIKYQTYDSNNGSSTQNSSISEYHPHF